MQVIVPMDLDVLDCNVPIEETAWDVDTIYAKDALVLVGGQQVYKSLTDNNQGNAPATDALLDSPHWTHVGPCNRYAALDERNTTQTVQADSIQYLLTGLDRDWLSIFNAEATSALIEFIASDSDDVLWSASASMVKPVDNYYDYFFTEPEAINDIHLQLPFFLDEGMVRDRRVRITLSSPGLTCRCGAIVMGQAQHLGDSVDDIDGEIASWSTFDDSRGELYLEKGRTASKLTVKVAVERQDMDRVMRILRVVDGRLVAWVLHNDRGNAFGDMTIRGALTKNRPTWSYGPLQYISLDIQSVAK